MSCRQHDHDTSTAAVNLYEPPKQAKARNHTKMITKDTVELYAGYSVPDDVPRRDKDVEQAIRIRHACLSASFPLARKAFR